ncbi:unnamed protein product [Clonostachys rosea f. rosea IK726]|uniref:Uncharacterized protein n=1 Tax=Clonostachys rosea f. rosea IK726 TaxID=1349383 RepID=A0ACA9T7Q0_BIOOC|nr:unnamed protein product [Clonostachys rosea f. rosea IK726]
MHAQAFLSLALAGLALAAPQAGPQGPRPTPDANWNWGGEHHNKTITTTKTLTAYTTYCPGPTTLHFNGKKYTVTQETTLTITDCPCTSSLDP